MNAGESSNQPLQRAREFLEDCWSELKKVHWPSQKETQAATIAVIAGIVLVATYLGIVDFLLTNFVRRVLG